MLHELASLNKKIATLQDAQQTTQLASQQQQAFTAFQNQVQALRAEFMKTNADFDAAYNHIRNIRMADLRAYGVPESDISRQLLIEEVRLSENAILNGKNPAAVLYDLAKRHGYTPTAAAAPGAPAPNATAKLEEIQRAQAAARPLSSTPSTPDPEISPEALRNATDTDLNKIVMDAKAWEKLSGRTDYPL